MLIMRNTLRSIVDPFLYIFPFSAVEMSLLLLVRFGHSPSIQNSMINLSALDFEPSAKESFCLCYDAYSLVQLAVALLCLKFFSAFFHIGSY